MNGARQTFLDTIPVARSVIASPEVAARWAEASALPELSVRGLAGHLARAVFTVETYLNAPIPPGSGSPSAVDYYLQAVEPAGWSDLSSAFNVAIRRRAEDQAAGGREHLLAELDESSARLHDRLRAEPEERRVAVFGDQGMRLDDYLVTRIVELTIHTDDLAVSVGLAPPDLPAAAEQATIAVLLDVACRRHGNLAVLRALARRERDTVDALRVL
jgi:Mycothiol maleylpyruvate isomerase N-terminal domain